MKEFDAESLSKFNGKEGAPVYVAHGGKVVDVSASPLWKTGIHMNRHQSGRDLTADLAAAPHGPEVLERHPQIGILQKEKAPDLLPAPVEALLGRFPFLRRHPHPMLVHFPIVFFIAAALFFFLFLLTAQASFATTSLHCLGAGLLFWPPAVLTGFASWWINYQARPLLAVRVKIVCSLVLLLDAVAAFLWRLASPAAILASGSPEYFYCLLLLALIPLVGITGWFGATLTFPVEKRQAGETKKGSESRGSAPPPSFL